MRFSSLYPYKNRSLNLSEYKVDKIKQCDLQELTKLLIANLRKDESLPLKEDTVTIISTSEDKIVYSTSLQKIETALSDELTSSTLFEAIKNELLSHTPSYQHILCEVLERDPAVFRLRDQTGWVINDTLCLSSGNVTYTEIKNDVSKNDVSENESHGNKISTSEVLTKNKQSIKAFLAKPDELGQLGFDF